MIFENDERELKYYLLCSCNNKNEALHVCFKCNLFICEFCKVKENHQNHQKFIIRVSKSMDFIKNTLKEKANTLSENILKEEKYLEMKNYQNFYLDKLNLINNNFEKKKEILNITLNSLNLTSYLIISNIF